jgi:glutathione S-transferase
MSAAARPAPGATTLYVKGGPGGASRGDCPFSCKALLALNLKRVPHVEGWVDFAAKPAWFTDLNPAGSTPTLVASDAEVVPSSDEIVALADEVGEGVRLYREESEWWAPAALVLAPVFGAFARLMKGKGGPGEPALRAELAEALALVEDHLKACGGPFMLGELPSAMDANLAPKVHHMLVAGAKYKALDLSEFAHVCKFFDAVSALPEWQASASSDEAIIEGWSRFF